MVNGLQFVAIAAFLIWCLVSSLSGLLAYDQDDARLVWREHGPQGWSGWRGAYFGLTAADRQVLTQPVLVLDPSARAALVDAVLQHTRQPDSDAIQYAIVHTSSEEDQPMVAFVSGRVAIAS